MVKIGNLAHINSDLFTANKSIQSHSANKIDCIWTAKTPNSAQGVNGVNNTNTQAEVEPKIAENDNAIDGMFEILKENALKKDFDENKNILERSKFQPILNLHSRFDAELREIGAAQGALYEELYSLYGNPDVTSVEGRIATLNNEVLQLASRIKNLDSKVRKAKDVDVALDRFVDKGGDINKIDLDKLCEDMLESLDKAEKETPQIDNSKEGNQEISQSADQKKLDEKIDKFLKIIDSEDPKKIEQNQHEYIKSGAALDNNNFFTQNNNDSKNNLFLFKKTSMFS